MARVAERANWLKLLDEAAAAWPPMPADTWYGGLLLIRHGHLRPIGPEGSLTRWFRWWLWEVRRRRLTLEADDIVRVVQLKRRTRRVESEENPEIEYNDDQPVRFRFKENVLADLTRRQRRQLAALIMDFDDELTGFASYQKHSVPWIDLQIAEARRAEPALKQNARIIKAATTLRELCGASSELAQSAPYVAGVLRQAAEDTIALHQGTNPWQQWFTSKKKVAATHPYSSDPKNFALVELYWFFHSECELSDTESQVRTAMVRNVLTPDDKITFHPTQGPYRRGSEAVRKAVARYTPPNPQRK